MPDKTVTIEIYRRLADLKLARAKEENTEGWQAAATEVVRRAREAGIPEQDILDFEGDRSTIIRVNHQA